ncbi:sulfite oxidase heme-binding subunit YedZ [Candidatus Leptofilum sp.]|uniref:sulfite oxidase heme-binding subunit YedZ n=1 Tax=Candidatus Leptofilum sp. TaxID=3241576 RepID=UPI003B5A054E
MSVISGRETAVSTQPKRRSHKKTAKLLTWLTHLGAWVPLAVLVAEYFTNNLGVDPVREILFHTGTTALVLLVLSLAVTPVNIAFGWKQMIPLRRPLGLYAFFYVCLHLLTFVWLDYALNLAFIVDGIVEQPFVLVGTIAFLLLIPLAITSTKGWQRRLGKRWKKLHKLSYLIIILVLVHFIWLVKNVYIEPAIYTGIVALLFLARWQPVKQKLLRWQRQIRMRLKKS